MKTLLTVLFALLVVQTLAAQTSQLPEEKKSAVVDNLTEGIESPNTGLHTSAAFVMYALISQSYLQSDDGKTDEERIAAAVALYELDNSIAIYQLRGIAVFDDNEKVATVCKNLYYSYHKLHGTEYLVSF